MNWPVQIFYVVLTVSLAVKSSSSASHDQGPRLVANHHSMRWSAGGGALANHHSMRLSAAHHAECGAGGTITACAGVRGLRAGMDCHRRYRNSIGTPCADPMNSKSMSLTQRGDTYTGPLRLHDTHGVCAYMHFSLVFPSILSALCDSLMS